MAVGYIRRKLGITAVKVQCYSLLGRLEGMGPGAMSAHGRRRRAEDQEILWAKERKAHNLCVKQGFSIARGGFTKLD